MDWSSFSLEGPKSDNQDRILVPQQFGNGWVAAIADGVGGNAGGGIAAGIAIDAVKETAVQTSKSLNEAFSVACMRMAEVSRNQPETSRMATTLSAVRVIGDRAQVGHAGDTRIYHVRGTGLITRTLDQTEVAQLVREGVLTPFQAHSYPRRNVINSYLSSTSTYDLFEASFEVRPGDLIILLTDGVYEFYKKTDLINLWQMHGSPKSLASELASRLHQAGARDDSSAVLVQV